MFIYMEKILFKFMSGYISFWVVFFFKFKIKFLSKATEKDHRNFFSLKIV